MEELLKTSFIAVLLVAGCAARNTPPSADQPAAPPPILTGQVVMVLPAQHGPAGGMSMEPVTGLDRELEFWLSEQTPRVQWVFASELERILARSPSLEIDLHSLAVSSFHRGEVRNIGDPLFGDLNKLGALTNARAALIPVAAAWIPDGAGSGRVEISVALIDNRTGRVIWTGVVAGQPGPAGSAGVAATAAEALAGLIAR